MLPLSQAQAAALNEAWQRHTPFVAKTISIRAKSGLWVPSVLSPLGDRVADCIYRQRLKALPVRIIVLKPRQSWASAAIETFVWKYTAFLPGFKSRVFADVHKNARNMYSYFKQYLESYRPEAAGGLQMLKVTRDVQDELIEFEGGGSVMFESAKNSSGARSHPCRFAHNTELAFWERAAELRTGLLGGIPLEPETFVIDESTANGMGGEFHSNWMQAIDPARDSLWQPIFLGCHEHPEYALPVQDPEAFQKSLTDEEWALKQAHGLTFEQLKFRRVKIDDFAGDSNRFKQEYPYTWEEAFLASGRPRFDLKCVMRMPVVADPVSGELERVRLGASSVVQFIPSLGDRGAVRVFRRPVAGRSYVVGADPAQGVDPSQEQGGASDPDFTALCVLDVDTAEQVAVARGRWEPSLGADICAALGEWYNWAYIVPEAVGSGLAFILALLSPTADGRPYRYPPHLIARRRPQADETEVGPLANYGFKTSSISRPEIIGQLARAIREMGVAVRDPWTRAELISFVYNSKGREEASPGSHDDCVFALALANLGMGYMRRAKFEMGVDGGAKAPTVQSYGQLDERGVLRRGVLKQ